MSLHHRLSAIVLGVLVFSMVGIVIPPEPARADALSFLSTPIGEGYVWYKYDYLIIPSNTSATLTLEATTATWAQLYLTNWHLIGFPNETNYGRCWMYLKLIDDSGGVAWQNFSVDVVSRDAVPPLDYNLENVTLLLCLVFGFGLMAFGLKRREFWILAGPVWIICGLMIFIDYGDVFLLASIGLGMFLFIQGVMKYAD